MTVTGKAALAVGAVVLLAGIVFGFAPITVDGVSCGSLFNASAEAKYLRSGDVCDEKRSDRKPLVIILVAIGIVGVLAGGVAHDNQAAAAAQRSPRAR